MARFNVSKQQNSTRLNDEIRVPEVRLISDDGEQIGVVETGKAITMAQERGLDLVEISPNADPPVCRIMDYGKFKFDQKKKQQEAKKKQKVFHIKEIKLSPNIDQHDFDFKVEHIKDFINRGDKVKVLLFFKGREITHIDIGFQVIDKVKEAMEGFAVIEKDAKLEGKNITVIFAPLGKK